MPGAGEGIGEVVASFGAGAGSELDCDGAGSGTGEATTGQGSDTGAGADFKAVNVCFGWSTGTLWNRNCFLGDRSISVV